MEYTMANNRTINLAKGAALVVPDHARFLVFEGLDYWRTDNDGLLSLAYIWDHEPSIRESCCAVARCFWLDEARRLEALQFNTAGLTTGPTSNDVTIAQDNAEAWRKFAEELSK